ncbi:MAG: hypothetical protein ABIQ04_03905 [Candidatus Saccharimonadales bacterium]
MNNSSSIATSSISPDFSEEDLKVLVEYFELLIEIDRDLKNKVVNT